MERQSNALPELLAPAGDMERLRSALLFGADAVYLAAKEFGMRAAPANFTLEELKTAVGMAHSRGAKVYLTCNIVPTNEEAEKLPEFLEQAAGAGVDALIVADMGVFLTARRLFPALPLHVSTQAGVTNYRTARELHALGASRVVLARELSLEDIKTIRAKTPPELEIEAFVHGAMCVSFSGRCLLSHYLTGRDSNRGSCSQPCRWRYRLVEEKRPGEYYPIEEEDRGSFILNAKDLCMLPYIRELAEAGISSFKIEGRAKSAYYTAVVTGAYRQAIDLYRQDPESFVLPGWLAEEVEKVSHREYSTGFYFGPIQNGQCLENGGYLRQWEVIAVVQGYKDGRVQCVQRGRCFPGDMVEVVSPGERPYEVKIEALLDGEGAEIASTNHAAMAFSFPLDREIPAGSLLRRKREG